MFHPIRFATLEDSRRLQEIYLPYVQNTAVTFEIELPTLEKMQSLIQKTGSKFPFLVYESGQTVVGYAYAAEFRPREAYRFSCEVTIYVEQGRHHAGTGKALYASLLDILQKMGFYKAYALITSDNENSIRFHELFGFQTVGTFEACGYKFDQWRSVCWMEKCFCQPSSKPQPIKAIQEFSNYFDR